MQTKRTDRQELRERLYRRRFLLPNAVTAANMFCGFLACIYASSGRFEKATLVIGIAILLDGLDGRVARRFNATSPFGLEFDSLSDLVSFGVAPALLIYHWCFQTGADEFGVMLCFFYVMAAASRLARFNVADPNLHSFTGLPTPGSAGLIAALVYAFPEPITGNLPVISGAIVITALAWLMVSKLEYISPKQIKVRGLHGMGTVILGVIVAFFWYNPRISLLSLTTGYVIFGPALFVYREQIIRIAEARSIRAGVIKSSKDKKDKEDRVIQ